jgi:hypothetical protein
MYGDYNLNVPQNFLGKYIPLAESLTNANSTGGAASTSLSVAKGTSTTTTQSHCWQVLFIFSGCPSASTTFSVSHTYTDNNGNLNVNQQEWMSGTFTFAAMTRAANASLSYAGPFSLPVSPGPLALNNWLSPTNYTNYPDTYLMPSWASNGYGQWVAPNAPQSGNVSTSSTVASTGLKGFDIDVGGGPPDVDIGTTIISDQWSQTSSYTTSYTLSWTVSTTQTNGECFTVVGQGGSASSSTATLVSVWAWIPTPNVAHNVACLLP